MERIAVLGLLAAVVAALVVAGRWLARHRLRGLRALAPDQIWTALATAPDGRPTVVTFSTPACAACRAQRPVLAALVDRGGGRVRVVHVDAARRPDVARTFGVLTVPATIVLAPTGAVLAANQGLTTLERLATQVGLAALAPGQADGST